MNIKEEIQRIDAIIGTPTHPHLTPPQPHPIPNIFQQILTCENIQKMLDNVEKW